MYNIGILMFSLSVCSILLILLNRDLSPSFNTQTSVESRLK